ncbi:MAG: hypothetical protein ACJ748_09970 [Flavisolibacter sp.]
MEDLFSTVLDVNKATVRYNVSFHQDKYIFQPSTTGSPVFSFRREHDEWHEMEFLAPEVKAQAIDALEKYLLKQH